MVKIRPENLQLADAFRKSGFSGKTALVLSTWFGSGLLPVAPGTFGTIAAIPLIIVLNILEIWYIIIILAFAIAIAVWSAGHAQVLLKKNDPSAVVIDEVAGFLLTMTFLPATWPAVILGFFLFRLFDIFKPYPIKHLEKIKGGFGIVMDDLLAGLYACGGTWMIFFIHSALRNRVMG